MAAAPAPVIRLHPDDGVLIARLSLMPAWWRITPRVARSADPRADPAYALLSTNNDDPWKRDTLARPEAL